MPTGKGWRCTLVDGWEGEKRWRVLRRWRGWPMGGRKRSGGSPASSPLSLGHLLSLHLAALLRAPLPPATDATVALRLTTARFARPSAPLNLLSGVYRGERGIEREEATCGPHGPTFLNYFYVADIWVPYFYYFWDKLPVARHCHVERRTSERNHVGAM